jgi:hypothetical protein
VGWQRDDSVKVIVFDHARVAVDLQRRSGVARLSPRVRIQGLDGRFGRQLGCRKGCCDAR